MASDSHRTGGTPVDLVRSLPSEGSAGSVVELVDGREELLGARQRQVHLLRELLPEKSFGVLVLAALPGL
jgi:hypothetical protein